MCFWGCRVRLMLRSDNIEEGGCCRFTGSSVKQHYLWEDLFLTPVTDSHISNLKMKIFLHAEMSEQKSDQFRMRPWLTGLHPFPDDVTHALQIRPDLSAATSNVLILWFYLTESAQMDNRGDQHQSENLWESWTPLTKTMLGEGLVVLLHSTTRGQLRLQTHHINALVHLLIEFS